MFGYRVCKTIFYLNTQQHAEYRVISHSPCYFYYMAAVKTVFDGPKYKIILVGDSQVGKTSIFWRYVHNQMIAERTVTTIDFGYKMIKLHDKQVKLCIWDTAGQEKFRSIVATYFKSCQGVVLVFDISVRQSWENIRKVWYQMAVKRVPNATYLLLGNKKDLPRSVPLEEIHEWCTDKGIYFIQTSALTGETVDQAFFTLSALIDSHEEFVVKSSFANTNEYVSQTTKECTKEGGSDRSSSVLAVYKQQKSQSFFLKKDSKRKKTEKEKCCR